jgi:hypothetical protein
MLLARLRRKKKYTLTSISVSVSAEFDFEYSFHSLSQISGSRGELLGVHSNNVYIVLQENVRPHFCLRSDEPLECLCTRIGNFTPYIRAVIIYMRVFMVLRH